MCRPNRRCRARARTRHRAPDIPKPTAAGLTETGDRRPATHRPALRDACREGSGRVVRPEFLSRRGPSPANVRGKKLIRVVDPHERYAVLIGAIQDMAKLNLHGSVGLALVDHHFGRSGSRKPPASENPIGVGRTPGDPELDVLGGTGIF